MSNRFYWLGGALLLGAVTMTALSWAWGQELPPPPPPTFGTPAAPGPISGGEKFSVPPGVPGQPVPPMFPIKPLAPVGEPGAEIKLSPAQSHLFLAARSGKEWLLRMNRPDGRFLYGLEPSLRIPLKEDNYLHQAAAAFALARSAKFFKEERAATLARQTLLTLLLDTEKDAKIPQLRYPVGTGVNPIGAAGWLVLAISELPQPGADLLKQSEELCLFLRSQQQKNGCLGPVLSQTDAKINGKDSAAWTAPGLALYALARSYQLNPEPWKLEVLRKGREYYQAEWLANKNTDMVPWHSAAFAEAYLQTKEQQFATCANEMNDWVCTLQFSEIQPQRLLWNGGFKKWEQGAVKTEAPDIHSAVFMEGLAQACRMAKERGDLQRYQAYRQAVEFCGQFLLSLQYNDGNSQHFETKYRQDFLLGGFHATHQSGLLRLDFTQEPVCALVKYLTDVAEVK